MGMRENALGSFARFTIGLFLFISISFGVTFAVQKLAIGQDAQRTQAAAAAAMLEQEK